MHHVLTSGSLADVVRLGAELGHALSGATGFKAVLRRFAEVMGANFGTERVAFAKVVGRNRKLTLKRRLVRLATLELLPDETVELIGKTLAETDGGVADMREGYATFSVGNQVYGCTVVDDPQSREGCLVVWQPVPLPGDETGVALQEALLDVLVRHLQGECRWYRKLEKTQAMLNRDDLTGLYNARYLDLVLDAELRRAERFQTQFCLLFIDLDGFKPINDNHGHLSGSSVLKQVAEVIRDAVREVDVAIRYGGDEFVVILLGATCSKGLLAAERVRKRIEQKDFALDGGAFAHVTASIGVAAYPDHGQDRETLLKMADETMYHSKRAGKNRVSIVGQRVPAP